MEKRFKRRFDKALFNNEQARYKMRYKNYFVGLLFQHPEFYVGRYLYHLRKAEKWNSSDSLLAKIMFYYHTSRKYHYSFKLGLQIGLHSCDYGIRIYHYGHIVINGGARIGKNLSIYPGVTIGQVAGDSYKTPIIGDNVWIYANAMVQGNITVGDNVIVAPNSVVTHDVPNNAIVAGVPAKIIGYVKK